MHNCLDQYADRMGSGMVRVFSIRRDGRRVATVEVGPCRTDGGPRSSSSRRRGTGAAPQAVRAAVEVWFDSQPLSRLKWRPGPVRSRDTDQARMKFWLPFLGALPRDQRDALEALVLSMNARNEGRRRRQT